MSGVAPGDADRGVRPAAGEAMRPASGQVDRGRPALGPRVQVARLVRLQLAPVEGGQQAGFAFVERQLLDPDLQHPAARPQARHRQTRMRAPRDRHGHAARQVVDDHRQDVDRRRAGQEVDVVEHEHHRPPGLVEHRRQPRDGVRQRRSGMQRRPGEDRPVEVEGTLDREADVAQEPDRIGVGGIARHPADGPSLLRAPQREAGRLAVARRRDHRHEAGIGPEQLPQQPVPVHDGRPEIRGGELRLDQRLLPDDLRLAERHGHGIVPDDARQARRMVGFPCLLLRSAHRSVIDRSRTPLRGEAAPV